MTDLELMEAAARAAGLTVVKWLQESPSVVAFVFDNGQHYGWSPLHFDSDALRLAVKLQIDLVHFTGHLRADVDGMPDVHQIHEGDPYAATRRAIVRAAAEIGRAMP